jgi:hypothetical protein
MQVMTCGEKSSMTPAQFPCGKVQQKRFRMQNSHSLQKPWLFISLRQLVGPEIKVRPLQRLFVVPFAANPTGSMYKTRSVPSTYAVRH